MNAIRPKTEYLLDPLGIDIPIPRLYWNCDGGLRQTAYRIVAQDALGREVWDSGRVESDRMTHIPYEGKTLGSRDRILWKVCLWDENGESGDWSQPASFEMGLLHGTDWTARWISGNYRPSRRRRYPVDCFSKTFSAGMDIAAARLYITACGLYEAWLNGQPVGDQRFTPGYTDYRQRVQYQTYDVTGMLACGENTLQVELADGWYRGSLGAFGFTHVFGKETKLLCQLEIRYADGSAQTVASDGSFAWSNDGPVRFADLKDGETVDALRRPSYADKAKVTAHPVVPTASNNVPVCEQERIKPTLIVTPNGQKLLDFGQNIAGIVEFSLHATQGQRIFLRFGEILDENGEFTQTNIQCKNRRQLTPLQQVEYFCQDGENRYKTRFAVFGFQYVLVQTDVPFVPEDFTAIAIYSAMEQTGSFTCSNARINRFVENTLWSMKGNFLDVPTDCPTRERAAWTGDAQIFFGTGSYLMNTAPFFRKWMKDVFDRQTRDGKVHCITPTVGNEMYISRMDGSVGWADAAVYIPYRYWKRYGDRQLLQDCYPGMRRYAKFMIGRTNRTGLLGKPVKGPDKRYTYNSGQAFGEWLEPRDMYVETIWGDLARPRPEEGTAYLSYTMALLCEIAGELDKPEDALLFAEYRDGAKRAYNHLFAPEGTIDTDRQAKLVRPLALGLLDDETRSNVGQRLVCAAEKRGYRIGTGFLSTPLILPVLTELGHADVAYKMLEQEEMPGWLYEVKQGATTVWENWDGSASRNHYSPGAVCEWLFDTACGIRINGENEFILEPQPGGTLTWAQACYDSVYGQVCCRWEKDGGITRYTVTIPANTVATMVLPDGRRSQLTAGTHELLQDKG